MKTYYISLKTSEKTYPIHVKLRAENTRRAELLAKQSALRRLRLAYPDELEMIGCQCLSAAAEEAAP